MDKRQIYNILPILITSLIWDINFRLTFKNMDSHMDLGSYPSLKFEPILILIKNISCAILFFVLYFIFKKINSSKQGTNKMLLVTAEKGKINYKISEENHFLLGDLVKLHNLNSSIKIILFSLKIFFLILIVYVFEELYFIVGNIHILDRLNVPMRNISVLFVILVLSTLLIKKKFQFYKHQLFSSVIVIGTSLFIILFNATSVERFGKIFNINFLYYMILYVLMGIEIVFDKYLTDKQFIDRLVILVLKGLIGTISFIAINILYNSEEFFYFFDKLMSFEYYNMYEEFDLSEKIFYVITNVIFIYLKMYIINKYTEIHFLAASMISDAIFFPLYLIEKFWVQKFEITTSSTFYLNIIFGVLNPVLLLIFSEIIELKCCGFEKDLNKNIEKRKQLEMNYTDSASNNDDEDDNINDRMSGNSNLSVY